MQDLKVTLIQAELVWQNPVANRARFAEQLRPLQGLADLVVLPEMFTTGFTMQPEQWAEPARDGGNTGNAGAVFSEPARDGGNTGNAGAVFSEPADGPTLQWLREQAAHTQAVITGSVAVTEAGLFYNRLYWVRPDGSYEYYDKRHLFRLGGEHEHYTAGVRSIMVELHGWKICPLVCYDLRFPVWSRRRAELDYDLLIYVANWPTVRRYPWQTLLRARAIENQAYCIGVNRFGVDGLGYEHSGDSVALDYMGKPVLSAPEQPWQGSVTLSYAELQKFRQKFPAHLDADGFHLDP